MGLKRVILPILGIDVESAVIEKWLKSEGDQVSRDEPIVLVETDKATTEIVAPADGVIRQILQGPGATVPVTQTLALLEVEGSGDVDVEAMTPAPPVAPTAQSRPVAQDRGSATAVGGAVRASPAARKAAKELGVDLRLVPGSGPAGRIQGSDVRAYSLRRAPVSQRSGESALPGRLVPLGTKRRITAERMSLSARTVARLTMNMEIDASEMIRLRADLMPVYERDSGVRLSYNDLIVKAVAIALKEHPHLNARWRDDGILLVDHVNVGMAVAVEDGLVVTVVRDADHKKLADISAELAGLISKARADKLSLEEMSGGTFTITSLGMFGIDSFTPIVNPPEAAILGVGRIVGKPVGKDGQIVLRSIMTLSLSFDHRVVDGAPAARFLQRVRQLLEEPVLLT